MSTESGQPHASRTLGTREKVGTVIPAGRKLHLGVQSYDMTVPQKRFAVALSFPGEQRPFIAKVAEILGSTLGKPNLLYDEYLTAELARPDMDLYLCDLYRNQSELLVPFYSSDYERKEWCGLEWRQMRDIIKQKGGDHLMPFRFDDAHIAGVLSIDGYVKIGDRTPESVADLILQRLESLRGASFGDDNTKTGHAAHEMSPEDGRDSKTFLLLLLAQAYYKILECATTGGVCAVDLNLNQSYIWTVTTLRNLLKNAKELSEFPEPFEPIFADLFPSTIRDWDWEEMVAPHAEGFLSCVQQFVFTSGAREPQEGSNAWIFVELFRPSVQAAIDQAISYSKRMQNGYRELLTRNRQVDTNKIKPPLGLKERVSLIKRISALSHGDIDALAAALAASGVSERTENRKARAAKLVEWACDPSRNAVDSLVTAAQGLGLTGFEANSEPVGEQLHPHVIPHNTSAKSVISTFCNSDLAGCAPYNAWGSGKVRFFRLGVNLESERQVDGCQAQLVKIEKDGICKWGHDCAILTFAPGENDDSTSKTLHKGKTEFVDLIALHFTGELRMGTKNREWLFLPRISEIFSEPGDYILTIILVGTGLSAHTDRVQFTWTGDMDSSSARMLGRSPVYGDRKRLEKLLNQVESRLKEVSDTVSQGKSAGDLSVWFTDSFVIGIHHPEVPMVHPIESDIINECNRASRDFDWHEFRRIANGITNLNRLIEDYNRPESATFDKAAKLLALSMQDIPPLCTEIRKQMLSRLNGT